MIGAMLTAPFEGYVSALPYELVEIEEEVEEKVEKNTNYTVVTARISAYAPYDNQSGICNDGDTLTSRGKPAGRQYVAVDENLIPYGSKIEIEGFDEEVFIAGDTGGTMRNKGRQGIYAVDVFFDTHQQAMDFGIQWREIRIYKEE